MRPKELGVVLFTFSGFYLLYEGALLVTDFLIRLLVAGENRGLFDQYPFGIFFAALPIFGTLYAGVGCIVWRNPLSARFFRESQASGEVPASTSMVAFEDWRAFWVGLVGVVFIVLALRDIAYIASTAIMSGTEVPGGNTEDLAFQVWPPRIRLAVQRLLGVFLVLGAPGLVSAWAGLRAAGRIRE